MDLQSTTKQQGKYTVTQIIHFINGEKRTFEGIKTSNQLNKANLQN